MENKMTVLANYAMRHPSCLQSHPTQPFFSKFSPCDPILTVSANRYHYSA